MCKNWIILEESFFFFGGGGVLKFFEGKRGGYEKITSSAPLAVYILNAALPNKKGGFSCDKVKFGTAIKIFGI